MFRGAAGIFLALLVILQIAAQVANNWAGKVNELLGVSDSTIERSTNPEDYQYMSDFENPSDLIQAEIALNTRLAAEGSVVLKGMPAIDGTQVTLFGMRSGEKMQFGGSMGELVDASNVVTLADAMSANGFSVNPDMVQFYKNLAADYAPTKTPGGNVVSDYGDQGAKIGEVPVSEYNPADIGGFTDAAVVVFGRDAGESSCFYPGLNGLAEPSEFTNSPTGNILSLSNDERDLITYVKSLGFRKIVVLLNSSTSMEIEELKTDSAIDSIIWIGNPGAYGTYGIAKLLSGEALPSGHLPDTFAVNSALSPAAQNFGIYTFANADAIETTTNHALRGEWYLVEAESIYTGYKYYETRYFDSAVGQGNASVVLNGETVDGGNAWDYDREVSYSFGYGVEGSAFSEEITGVNIDWSGETDSTVTVKVTNTGKQAAKHAVQLYVSVPYTDNDRRHGVEKSAIQLIGYAKTGEARENTFEDVVLLEPGQSEDVTVAFNAQDFYSYDRTYVHDGTAGAYVLEAGDYYFATGNGAHDAVQAVLMELHPDLVGSVKPTVAATFSPFLQREEGRLIGNDGIWTGYDNWNGPGMNLHRTPYNGRNVGYYSEDAVLTGLSAMYVHRGLTAKGMVTQAKHFAFNDQETNRDGIAVFLSEQAARENELRGFQIPIRDGSLKGLMSAFNRIGCVHVAASDGLMNGILRGEWGFNGRLITDSVKSAQYFLPRECLVAGNDMMLGGSNNGKVWNFTADTVEDDVVLQGLLREAFHRKLYTFANSVLMNGITPESGAGGGTVWWVLAFQIAGGVCFVGFVALVALFLVNERKERRQ